MSMEAIAALVDEKLFAVWFLIGAALVFWMQAGFAMVETGFTRAKNAGNILMKNLMDFCIGTVVFILIGFGLFLGEDLVGLIGKPGFDIFTAYADFNWSSICLQPGVLRDSGNHCFRRDGRAHEVPFVLHLFCRDFGIYLPDRGALDLGRRLACTDRLP